MSEWRSEQSFLILIMCFYWQLLSLLFCSSLLRLNELKMAAQCHRDVTLCDQKLTRKSVLRGVFDSFTAYARRSYRYWKCEMNKIALYFLIDYIDVRIETYYRYLARFETFQIYKQVSEISHIFYFVYRNRIYALFSGNSWNKSQRWLLFHWNIFYSLFLSER